ncbi:transposase [Roseomonas sp. GCM10028921]
MKTASPEFASMRQLAMRFRGILRGGKTKKLDRWCEDTSRSGIDAMRRFAKTLQRDRDAVHSALTLPWSNGQTEGQISRLKTLKRACTAVPEPTSSEPGCSPSDQRTAPRMRKDLDKENRQRCMLPCAGRCHAARARN